MDKDLAKNLKVLEEFILNSIEEISELIAYEDTHHIGNSNHFGDKQLKIDVLADEIIFMNLRNSRLVKYALSEEKPELVSMGGSQFIVTFDPLDGSSIIDVNWAVGTIYAIWPTDNDLIGQKDFPSSSFFKVSSSTNPVSALYFTTLVLGPYKATPEVSVFSGKGFDYGEYYARQGSPSPPPPTQRHPLSTNQGFGFFKSDTAPTPQSLAAANIRPSLQGQTEVRNAVTGSGFHSSSVNSTGFGFRPNSVNYAVSGFHPNPINNSGVHSVNNVERTFRNLNVTETELRPHAPSVQCANDDKPNSGFKFQFKKAADETKSPEQQPCERPRSVAGPRVVNGAVYGGFAKAAAPRSSYNMNNNMEKK